MLLLYSTDAHAWGLYTHIYFAQHLLWAIPLSDPRHLRAVRRFPGLVLAGACLPDLALVAARFGLHGLADSHDWQHPRRLLHHANDDAECAIAIGYASHLWVDIIAHNHFVPAHEAMWPDIPLATHAVAEWAMDHYLGPQLYRRPAQVLRDHEQQLVQYVSLHFAGNAGRVRKALVTLTAAEATLRQSGLPWLLFRSAQAMDKGLRRRLDYYLRETSDRLRQINRLLSGEIPQWLADPTAPADRQAMAQRIAGMSRLRLRHRMPLPPDFFLGTES